MSRLVLGLTLLGGVPGLSGCADNGATVGIFEAEPVVIRVLRDTKARAGGGSLRVQTEYDAAGQVQVPEPVSDGLSFEADGPPFVERVGKRDVITQRYVFRGRPGHYEIPPIMATWTSPDGEEVTAQSTPLFLDIDVDPPDVPAIVDIEEPSPIRTVPWVPFVSIAALVLAASAWALWPRPATPSAPVYVAPDRRALERWDEIRTDTARSDEDRARELSLLFRQYMEAVLKFEASAWTTHEILEYLRGLTKLPQGNVLRAKRMLRAADRIKFAEERSTEELIEELDADLRAFIDATRPTGEPLPSVPTSQHLPWWVPVGVLAVGVGCLVLIELSALLLSGASAPLWLRLAWMGLVGGAIGVSRTWKVS